jgi:transcriptional regulator with XRE-family HTH domain
MALRSERMREVRVARGLTQEELAARIGINLRQISRYEAGESDPTGDALARLAKEMQVSADYLLGLTDDPNEHLGDELSPMERKLIAAVRSGHIVEALQTFTTLSQQNDQPGVSGVQPAVNR